MPPPGERRSGPTLDPAAPAAPLAEPPDGTEEDEPHHGPFHFLRELPGLILVAFLLALLIKSFLVQAFFIPSQSMENTLQVGDRVLVNKVVYRFRQPRRGEVIVFENPHAVEPDRGPVAAFLNWVTEGLGFSSNPEKDFIKRVVGLPGDVVEMSGGRTFVNGKAVEEPYLHPQKDLGDYGPYRVPRGRFFVMGDNRANSQDSRYGLGAIPEGRIVGKAFVVLWPPKRFEWLASTA
ncbi:MAG TPA: signal peptidase I [Actinomycetota bacterium]|nr:signal peptidase I [Actinomycetota bacterium]